MEFGPVLIIECPVCGALADFFTLGSGNTIRARWWTDGKMVAPMLPEAPAITECDGCGDSYWIADAKAVGQFDLVVSSFFEKDEATELKSRSGFVSKMTDEMILDALSIGAAQDRDQELYLRMRLWWLSNDPFRSNYEGGFSLAFGESSTRKKIKKLLNLLNMEKWVGDLRTLDKEELKRTLEESPQSQFKLKDQWTKLNTRAKKILTKLLA